ncbi:MAG: PAS domain-containing protein [Pseudomonadota bacterium]
MSLIQLVSALVGDRDLAVVVTDGKLAEPGPNILYVNAAFERMTGYASHEVVGKSPRMLQGPLTSVAAKKRLARALRLGVTHRTTLINYRKSGEAYRCEIEVFPLFTPSGEPFAAVALEREVPRRPGRRSAA